MTYPAVVLALAFAAQAGAADPATVSGARFYFSGDGVLDLYSTHSDEQLTLRYRDAQGRYDPAALARITQFFRSRSDGRSGPISLRLIELIDYVQDHYRPRRLALVSGYRSPAFNQALRESGHRVAQASLHTEGMAADVQPTGLNLRRLWLQLRALRAGGVGLYQSEGFIHLDTGAPRFWEAATSGVEKNLSADNARLFARTDFDRYADLRGAIVGLHAVTALPIRIAPMAHLGEREVALTAVGDGIALDGDCYVISEPADQYAFTVTSSVEPPLHGEPLRLQTCPPRIGATPEEIVSNPVERLR
jgi:uncharacterized protein YcbK (DUF882 family)